MKQRSIVKKTAIFMIFALILFYFLCPVLWLFLSSIQPEGELTVVPPNWFPKKITIDNFRSFFDKDLRDRREVPGAASEVGSSLLNSTIIAIFVAMGNLLIAVPAAYTFARFSSKSLSFWYIILLIFRMVPAVAIIIPFYFIFQTIGLLGNLSSVILGHSIFTLPIVVWILRGFFVNIPIEIEEAALLDGCTRFTTIIRVVLPIVMPGLIAAAVYAFMFSWNEFFFSLVLTAASQNKTVPVVAAYFASDVIIKYGVMNAAAVVAIIPPVVLALIFSSYLRKGLTAGYGR